MHALLRRERVTITGASPPAERESASVFSAGPGLNITPGDSRNFTFTTQAAYPTNGGGTLNVSSTCATGSDVSSQVSGPAGGAPPPPPPPPADCQCTALTGRLQDPTIHALHGRFLGFKLRWRLTCSPGAAANCRGRIRIATFPGDVSFTRPRSKTVRCVGACGKTRTKRSELRMLSLGAPEAALERSGQPAAEARQPLSAPTHPAALLLPRCKRSGEARLAEGDDGEVRPLRPGRPAQERPARLRAHWASRPRSPAFAAASVRGRISPTPMPRSPGRAPRPSR